MAWRQVQKQNNTRHGKVGSSRPVSAQSGSIASNPFMLANKTQKSSNTAPKRPSSSYRPKPSSKLPSFGFRSKSTPNNAKRASLPNSPKRSPVQPKRVTPAPSSSFRSMFNRNGNGNSATARPKTTNVTKTSKNKFSPLKAIKQVATQYKGSAVYKDEPNIDKQLLTQINDLYKFVTKNDGSSLKLGQKLEELFQSEDEKVYNNTIYFGNTLLSKSQAAPVLVGLLLSQNDTCVDRVLYAITNSARQDFVVGEVLSLGLSKVLSRISSLPTINSTIKFMVNFLANERAISALLKQSGFQHFVTMFSKASEDEEAFILSIKVLNNLVVYSAKTGDSKKNFSSFATKKFYMQVKSILKNANTMESEDVASFLASIANLATSIPNRDMIRDTGNIDELMRIANDSKLMSYPRTCEYVIMSLGHLLEDVDCASIIIRHEGLRVIIKNLKSQNEDILSAALAAIINYATKDGVENSLQRAVTNSDWMSRTLPSLLKSKNEKIRLRSAWAICNLTIHDSLHEPFDKYGGLTAVLDAAKSGDVSSEAKKKIVTTIYHLSIFHDSMRNKVLAKGGVTALKKALESPVQMLKEEAAKAMVNLTTAENSEEYFIKERAIPPLVDLLKDKKASPIAHEVATAALGNLALSEVAGEEMRKAGVMDAALSVLQDTKQANVQQRSANLLARLAFNSKTREEFQKGEGEKILQGIMSKCTKNTHLTQTLKVALNNMAVPHFENESKAPVVDEFAEFKDYDLDSDSEEDPRPVQQQAPPTRREAPQPPAPSFRKKPPLRPNSGVPKRRPAPLPPGRPKKKPMPPKKPSGMTPKLRKKLPPIPPKRPQSTPLGSRVEIEDHALKPEEYMVMDDSGGSRFKTRKYSIKRKAEKLLHKVGLKKEKEVKPHQPVSRMDSNASEDSMLPFMRDDPDAIRKRSKSDPALRPIFVGGESRTRKVGAKPIPADVDKAKLERAKRHFKRTKIAQELLKTEGNYVKDLDIIIKKFMQPLLQASKMSKTFVNDKDINNIFSNVEILHSYNMMLLTGLNSRMSRWTTTTKIGDIFLYMTDFLKAYTVYVNNYDHSQRTLVKCASNNAKFQKFMLNVSSSKVVAKGNPPPGIGIENYLITPIQRPPRYQLLLQTLIKNTDPDHSDYDNLVKALGKVKEVNQFLNSQKEHFTGVVQIIEVLKNLEGNIDSILRPDRRLIGTWNAGWVDKTSSVPSTGRVVLFNDSVMYTKFLRKERERLAGLIPVKYTRKVDICPTNASAVIVQNTMGSIDVTFTFQDIATKNEFYDRVKKGWKNMR